jgi:hypothetical protein
VVVLLLADPRPPRWRKKTGQLIEVTDEQAIFDINPDSFSPGSRSLARIFGTLHSVGKDFWDIT